MSQFVRIYSYTLWVSSQHTFYGRLLQMYELAAPRHYHESKLIYSMIQQVPHLGWVDLILVVPLSAHFCLLHF